MSTNNPEVKEVHYVVVVHGIGEQRPNETVPAVISRFAEARKLDYQKCFSTTLDKEVGISNFISMGKVAAQAGTKKREGKIGFAGENPWSQFEGIPKKFGGDVGNFNAVQSEGEDDVRFIDMFWADILDDYFKISGQSVQAWTDSVLSRLTNSGEYDAPEKSDANTSEEDEIKAKEERNRMWIMRVLTQVQETALFTTKVAGLPWIDFGDELKHVMDNVVGDIQIYGENRSVRGEAVARFHSLMEKIHEQHLQKYLIADFDTIMKDQREAKGNITNADILNRYAIKEDCPLYAEGIRYVRPKVHIVAHSLGTVMSMDALMYAHVKKDRAYPEEFKSNGKPIRNLPFEMYGKEKLEKIHWDVKANKPKLSKSKEVEYVQRTEGEYIGSNWIDNVESLVTLGSPIDKFLVLYPENYQFMDGVPHKESAHSDSKINEVSAAKIFTTRGGGNPTTKIRHYNYCDEQDPVGHHLDLIKSKGAYNLIFDNKEGDRDVVFNQYQVPGVAHVMYWEDQVLMRRILHQTIDGDPSEQDIKAQVAAAKKEKDENEKKRLEAQSFEASGNKFTIEHSPSKNFKKVMRYTYYWPWLVSGLAISCIFYWGWLELQANPTDYMWPAIVALIFSMTGYFFRKIISLLIWWRQALRTKSNNAEGKEVQKYHSARASNRFRRTMKIGFWFWFLFSTLTMSAALSDSSVITSKEGLCKLGVYLGLIVAGGFVVYFIGKKSWSRSYGKKETATKIPEWKTVFIMIVISVLTAGIVTLLQFTDRSLSLGISNKVLTITAILTCGLTISWIYVYETLKSVKKELLGKSTNREKKFNAFLARLEDQLSEKLANYSLVLILLIGLAMGAYYIISGMK